MIGAEVLLRFLNLDLYFTVPGRFTIPINVSLKRINGRSVMVPDERCAGHAADGYARASNKPAGLIVSAGPGALNATLSVATAYRDYVPMVVIAGDVPSYSKGSLAVEEVDLEGIFSSISKDLVYIGGPRDLALAKTLAESVARPPRQPVFIDFPLDQQEAEVKALIGEGDQYVDYERSEDIVVQAREVAKLLEASKRPLILIGNGCIEVHNAVARFAEQNQIPVAYTLMGWCRVKSRSKVSLGFCGIRGFKSANQALEECDLLIALGARLSEATTAHGLSDDATIVQVLVENHFHSKAYLKVMDTCERFLEALVREYRGGKKSLWIKQVGEEDHGSKTFNIIRRLLRATKCTILSLDMGDSSMWALEAVKHEQQGLILYPGGLATMGFSVPAALGAQLARPDEIVLSITGDGGALISLPALHAISRLKLPIAVTVFNNRVYGMVRGKQLRDYGVTVDVELDLESFEGIAKALKINYIKIEGVEDVKVLADKPLREPILIEVHVEADDRPPTPIRLFPRT